MNYRTLLLCFSTAFLFNVNATAKVITEKTAESLAKEFMSSKGLADKDLEIFNLSDNTAQFRAQSINGGSPAYHIFSRTDHNGFIIVSGDDIARPILGYSFESRTDGQDEMPPAMIDWLNDIEKQILQARKYGLPQSEEIADQWKHTDMGNVVKQQVTAKWNQGYPFNLQCPLQDGYRCVTGCVATAYAILMKFYGYPSAGSGITPAYTCTNSGVYVESRNLNHSYDWDSMPLVYNSYTDQQANNVAQLMADIGAAIQADYTNQETSAYYNSINKGALFKNFGYNVGKQYDKDNYTIAEWYSMLKEGLENHPVLYRGESEDGTGGHAFIIDGYTDNDYFCVNWGWGGSYNGAFVLDALNVSTINFNSAQSAFFDFQPAVSTPAVVRVNDMDCPSLEVAFGVAPANGQPTLMTMLQNDTLQNISVTENQNIILDLNGADISIENYGIFNRGKLTVKDSQKNGTMTVTKGNSAIFNNYNILNVEGGIFTNTVSINDDETDYRRCIWTAAESTTHISGGKFTCVGQVVCINSKLIIDNGEFECTGNNDVIVNYAIGDTLTINGGIFKNNTYSGEGNNYRRAIWSAQEATTYITNGQFSSRHSVICTNGKMTIENGTFICYGNSQVIANYIITDTLAINGGIVKNVADAPETQDYRRAIWTAEGTITHITGGEISSDYQVITFNGEAIIDGGIIENVGNGLGCLSAGKGVINDCKLSATRILAVISGYSLECFGGIYSQTVADNYLGSGCRCISNNDPSTATKYPYKVVNGSTEIDVILPEADENDVHYDLNGIIRSNDDPGLHIIRKDNGKNVKIIYMQ